MGGDNVQLSAGANPGQRIRARCAIRIMVGRGEIVSARKGGDNVRLSAGENPGQMRDLHQEQRRRMHPGTAVTRPHRRP